MKQECLFVHALQTMLFDICRFGLLHGAKGILKGSIRRAITKVMIAGLNTILYKATIHNLVTCL